MKSLFPFFKAQGSQPQLSPDNQIRYHHYELAHRALSEVAFHDPLAYLSTLASDQAPQALGRIFAVVEAQCAEHGPAGFQPSEIATHFIHVEGRPCLVVEMPKPLASPEVYYTALIVLSNTESEEDPDPEAIEARYFTLELGFDEGGRPEPIFAEWTADGQHLNYGPLSSATLEAFSQHIAQLLET